MLHSTDVLATCKDKAFISLLVQLTLLMLGGREILAGRFSLGLYVVFSAYLSMLIVRFRYFLNFWKSYQSAMTSYTRLEHILQLPNENCGKQQMLWRLQSALWGSLQSMSD